MTRSGKPFSSLLLNRSHSIVLPYIVCDNAQVLTILSVINTSAEGSGFALLYRYMKVETEAFIASAWECKTRLVVPYFTAADCNRQPTSEAAGLQSNGQRWCEDCVSRTDIANRFD